jgi:FixJ family two-component response regulator
MFPSAREFLASLPAAAPDCLVLDVQMPEMNGLELQDKLIELGYCIPVILITAHDTPQFRQRAHPIETAALLIKPFDGSALLGAVRRTLAVFTTCAGDGFEGR